MFGPVFEVLPPKEAQTFPIGLYKLFPVILWVGDKWYYAWLLNYFLITPPTPTLQE